MIVVLVLMAFMFISDQIFSLDHTIYNNTDFTTDITAGNVNEVEIYQNQSAPAGEVAVSFKDEERKAVHFYVTDVDKIVSIMSEHSFHNYYVHDVSKQSWVMTILPYILIAVMFFMLILFMTNQGAAAAQSSGNSKMLDFGKARADMTTGDDMKKKVTFADVAGLKDRINSIHLEQGFLRASYLQVLREPVRHFLQELLLVRQACRSFLYQVPISLKCL